MDKKRRNITILVAALAVFFTMLSYILMIMRVANMHTVFYLVLGFSILVVSYMVLWTLGTVEKFARTVKILKYCYLVCLILGVILFIILQILILSGIQSEDADADVIIVLGAGVYNGVPSLILVSRLSTAYDYMQAHPGVPVIVTGGLGRGEEKTDAEVMARYLIARGIDESLVWIEDKSTNTRENFTFSIEIITAKGIDINSIKVAVISNEFHLYRARIIAEKVGLDALTVAAETPGFFRKILCHFREAISLTLEFFFN